MARPQHSSARRFPRVASPRLGPFSSCAIALVAVLVTAVLVKAQEPAQALPAGGAPLVLATGPGADVFQRTCVLCHTPERIVAIRKTRAEWEEVIDKMIARGAQVTDDNYGPIEEFLLRNYSKLNINKAAKDDIVLIVGLSEAEADALLTFRAEHGPFADFDALGKVPGLDAKKLDGKKDAITF